MTQLDIFDVVESNAGVYTKENVEPTQETEDVEPTYFIEYLDVDQRLRLSWIRAKDEDAALYMFSKENKRTEVLNVSRSDRTLEELNALD